MGPSETDSIDTSRAAAIHHPDIPHAALAAGEVRHPEPEARGRPHRGALRVLLPAGPARSARSNKAVKKGDDRKIVPFFFLAALVGALLLLVVIQNHHVVLPRAVAERLGAGQKNLPERPEADVGQEEAGLAVDINEG